MHNKSIDNNLLTKKQLMSWLNDLLKLQVSSIEQLSNGAAFCQLVDIISSGAVRMQKINWNAKLQHQNLANLKILSTAMLAAGIDKKFDVIRISQKKTQDILQLFQWFRKYFISNHLSFETYDPITRRRSQSTQKNLTQIRSSLDNNRKQKSLVFPKPQLSAKRQSQDIITDSQLKNCLRVNKAIEKIITQETHTPAEAKLELIKKLIFKKSEPTQHFDAVNHQHESFNKTISSSSNIKTIPDRQKMISQKQQIIKIQTSHYQNPQSLHESISNSDNNYYSDKTSQMHPQIDAKDAKNSIKIQKRIHKSQKMGRN